MAYQKEIRGVTPKYTMQCKDAAGDVIDPTTYELIEIYIYNLSSGNELVKYTTEYTVVEEVNTPPEGFILLEPDSEKVEFTIPEAITLEAESGDTRIEIWTEDADGLIECETAVFNEFIDAQNGI